jgi:MFS family permease
MFGVTQGLVEPRMRATASALLLLIVNLIGFALGPPMIGALSDFLAGVQHTGSGAIGAFREVCADPKSADAACMAARADGLKLAMIIGVLGYAWGGVHFLLAGRTMRKDVVS